MELIKDILEIFGAAALAFIGYLLINATYAIDIFDTHGNLSWRAMFICLAMFAVGSAIIYFGEKLWERLGS